MFFCAFFHVQPKHQNGAVFVDIEGFRPCLSKPSDGAPKRALMARLMQKERLKSPQKSPIPENQAFFGHFGHFCNKKKTAILVILASHFRDRVRARRKKAPCGGFLRSTRPSYSPLWPQPNPPEARENISTGGGVVHSTARPLDGRPVFPCWRALANSARRGRVFN
jgi:hypothetical protein